MGVAKPLHLRLFLEGKEVPVISAQVQVNMWAPAAAAIQIVPLDSALDFKPRTMVHLFFLEEPKVQNGARAPLTGPLEGQLADTAYKLMFCGEIVGFSFVKTPMSRAVVLQCLDHSSYWDQLQATMMDYGPQGNAFVHKAALYASDETLFSSVPTQQQAEKLRSWLLGKSKTPGWERVGGLAGGILNLMEQMAGLRHSRLGVNDFYSLAEIRCHLLGQVTAEDGDNTAQNLLDIRVFFDWILNNLQNLPGQISLRDMVKILCQYIYYQVAPNPIAKFDEASKEPRTVSYGPKDVKLAAHKNFLSCLQVIQSSVAILDPTKKESRTKSDVQQLYTSVTKTLIPQLKEMQNLAHVIAGRAEQMAFHLQWVVEHWDDKVAGPTKVPVLDNKDQVIGFETSQDPHPREGRMEDAHKFANQIREDFENAKQTTVVRQPGGTYQVSELARLRTQVFRPDCFMAAPPVCNVIFPEMYSQATYDRNFIQEVTRVEISFYNQVVGQDALTAQHFIEPNIRKASLEVAKHLQSKWRILMDHELHTGIIAREEWLPDSFNVRRQDDKLKQASISWTHRTGLHHFFKFRIGPRTMNVAGRFMPNLVCGFPALVIQKPFYFKDGIKAESHSKAMDMIMKSQNPAKELGAPPQFLGMVEGFSHSLGQDGGSTQVSLSHCRNHLGIDDEFVGVVLDKVRRERSSTDAVFYRLNYDVANMEGNDIALKFLADCTPQDYQTTSELAPVTDKVLSKNDATYFKKEITGGVESVTQVSASITSSLEATAPPPSFNVVTDGTHPNKPAGVTIKIPKVFGKKKPGDIGLKGGKIKLIEVLEPYTIKFVNGISYFPSIIVYEERTRVSKDESPVPVEYVVQPGWLSTSYDNENIGPKVYMPFFGCNSIVDMISMGDVGSIPERIDEKGMYVTIEEDEKAIDARLKITHDKRNFYSIEKAVNLIAYLYGRAKSEHMDVDEFVSTFVSRPIATKENLLGSHDLELKVEGSKVTKVKGTIGFHTLSVHEKTSEAGKLVGLMEDPTMTMTRMNKAQKEAMRASYDVRAAKLAKVKAYIDELTNGKRGFVG